MPPGTGEEVRGLLQLHPDAAVVVPAPQRISESAVRKVVVMAQEYRIPLLGLLQNNPNAGAGEAGRRLAELFRLPLLAEVPWLLNIQDSMEGQVPFDHQPFLPVAQALADALLAPPVAVEPLTNEDAELLKEAEEWVTGQGTPVPAPPARPSPSALGVFVGENPEAESSPNISPNMPPDMSPELTPNISSAFHEITDDQWAELRPLIPEAFQENRGLFNGILWVFTTENPWREMPEEYGKSSTARSRVTRMRKEGFWDPFLHKAKQFGYAPLLSEYIDDNANPDDDEEVLRDGDGAGQQGWPGGPSEGDAPEVDQPERAPEATQAPS